MEREKEYDEEELLMVKAGGRFSDLPSDLFLDILSRLPLKSVSQCKWVSKTWFSLIHRPRFAELHYHREAHDRCPTSIFLTSDIKDFHMLDYELFDNFGSSTTPQKLEFKGFDEVFRRKSSKREYEVVGCVNGLICFSSDPLIYGAEPYYIVNPITGHHFVLPKSPEYEIAHVISGFGFDPATKQYKVIRVLQDKIYGVFHPDFSFTSYHPKPAEAEIITLGSNTWRRIKNIPYITDTSANNVLVNGNLHWVSHRNLKDLQDIGIVSFNVGNEELKLIEPPPCSTRKKTVEVLRVYEGSLCLISAYHNSHVAGSDTEMSQIWVMKEYGVQSSWVKQHVISLTGWDWYKNRELIKIQNDEILLRLSKELGYYNLKENSFRPIKIHQMSALHYRMPPMIQLGSLFSPRMLMN